MKYYPPDFDPSKIPKLKLPKDRQYVVRLMAPFNMRCKTCGEYIYKGKKFNARKETVQNEVYLGLPIFRFYIKCTRCLAEITFKTDPENTDYTMEHGATRNFQAEKLLEEEEKRVQKEREDEELNNPMKGPREYKEILEEKALLEEARTRRLLEDSDSEDEAAPAPPRPTARPRPTTILYEPPKAKRRVESWERSVGSLGSTTQLADLVVVRKTVNSSSQQGLRGPVPGEPLPPPGHTLGS
ncbi:splicing factor YJU2 [Echinops telfairi]|uniref:Splicing factor YJU2 n=1 Tax=Echinops telfairi TaxID=9371 RepID=A0AC59C738_ECHTE|nr:splicing factor YJU2 [Echinops telfairi]